MKPTTEPTKQRSEQPGSRERNNELYPKVVAGDKAAREEMILANMGLVQCKVDAALATFPGMRYLRDDLVSEGTVGLIEGINQLSAEHGEIRNENLSGYLGTWIWGAIGAVVDKEQAIGSSKTTVRRKRKSGETMPKSVPLPRGNDPTYDPTSMAELRDIIQAACETEVDKTIVEMREAGHTDQEIAGVLDLPHSTVYMLRRELYARFLDKSEMQGEV